MFVQKESGVTENIWSPVLICSYHAVIWWPGQTDDTQKPRAPGGLQNSSRAVTAPWRLNTTWSIWCLRVSGVGWAPSPNAARAAAANSQI